VITRADGAGDHVAAHPRGGLGGDLTAAQAVGDDGVIVGDLGDVAAAREVDPGVADVGDDREVALDEQG
jgi:hypothetical protein